MDNPNKIKKWRKGQSLLEFTFGMIVLVVLIYALLMIFRWVGLDLAERRSAHDRLLTNSTLRPEQQLNPDFYTPRKLDATYRSYK